MPLYGYRCTECNTEFEKLLSFKERNDRKTVISCPECSCEDSVPLISKTSFSLKGGGWYKDGYSKSEN